jgi:hypothetical protein
LVLNPGIMELSGCRMVAETLPEENPLKGALEIL